jgi:hypothetical protein
MTMAQARTKNDAVASAADKTLKTLHRLKSELDVHRDRSLPFRADETLRNLAVVEHDRVGHSNHRREPMRYSVRYRLFSRHHDMMKVVTDR